MHKKTLLFCRNMLFYLQMRKCWITFASLFLLISFYTNAYTADSGTMFGKVVWEDSYSSIPDATLRVYNIDGTIAQTALTDENGRYSIDIIAGEYYLSAEKNSLVMEYYPGEYLFKEANRITVFPHQNVCIEFELNSGGWISGNFDFEGEDVDFALVTALKVDEPQEGWFKSVTLDGPFPSSYAISGLLPGLYKVLARARGKNTQYFPGVSDIEDAQILEVHQDNGVLDISFALSQAGWGSIYGRVANIADGNGVPAIQLYAYQWKNFWEDPNLVMALTGQDGAFCLRLPAGEYSLFALYLEGGNSGATVPIFYDNCYDPMNAAIVPVNADQVVSNIDFNIDFSIAHNLSISGVVSSLQTGAGLDDIIVTAIDYQTGQAVGSSFSANEGEYSIGDLAPGQYLIMYSGNYIIPYFYPQASSWQDGEVITLQGHFGNVRTEAITQDYGNMGLAVTGTVTCDDDPVAGARVYAFLEGQSTPIAYARTDVSGQYTIVSGLVPGSYRVMCDHFGYNNEIYPIPIYLDLLTNPIADGIDFQLEDASTSIQEASLSIPDLILAENYPNPFNSSTVVVVYSGYDSEFSSGIIVYNTLGQVVGKKDIIIHPGMNSILWDASDFNEQVTSGVYFYKVEGLGSSRRMLFLK